MRRRLVRSANPSTFQAGRELFEVFAYDPARSRFLILIVLATAVLIPIWLRWREQASVLGMGLASAIVVCCSLVLVIGMLAILRLRILSLNLVALGAALLIPVVHVLWMHGSGSLPWFLGVTIASVIGLVDLIVLSTSVSYILCLNIGFRDTSWWLSRLGGDCWRLVRAWNWPLWIGLALGVGVFLWRADLPPFKWGVAVNNADVGWAVLCGVTASSMLLLGWRLLMSRRKIIIGPFAASSEAAAKQEDNPFLSALLLAELLRLRDLYEVIDDARPTAGGVTVQATVSSLSDVSELTGAIGGLETLSVSSIAFKPLTFLLHLIERLMGPARLTGILEDDCDRSARLVMIATLSGYDRRGPRSWRVTSDLARSELMLASDRSEASGFAPAAPAPNGVTGGAEGRERATEAETSEAEAIDRDELLRLMVKQLAVRIFTDLCDVGSRKWEAVEAYTEGLRSYRDTLLSQIGSNKRLIESERLFIKAHRNDGEFVMNHYNLGIVYLKLHRNDEARASLIQAIKENLRLMDPEPTRLSYASYALARIHFDDENYEQATLQCLQSLSMHRDSARTRDLLGRSLIKKRQYEEGIHHLKIAVALAWHELCRWSWVNSPAHDSGWEDKFRRCAATCLLNLAEATDQEEASRGPDTGKAAARNRRRSISLLKQAIRLAPNQKTLYTKLGRHLTDAKRRDEAKDALESAVSIEPRSSAIRVGLARAYVDLAASAKSPANTQQENGGREKEGLAASGKSPANTQTEYAERAKEECQHALNYACDCPEGIESEDEDESTTAVECDCALEPGLSLVQVQKMVEGIYDRFIEQGFVGAPPVDAESHWRSICADAATIICCVEGVRAEMPPPGSPDGRSRDELLEQVCKKKEHMRFIDREWAIGRALFLYAQRCKTPEAIYDDAKKDLFALKAECGKDSLEAECGKDGKPAWSEILALHGAATTLMGHGDAVRSKELKPYSKRAVEAVQTRINEIFGKARNKVEKEQRTKARLLMAAIDHLEQHQLRGSVRGWNLHRHCAKAYLECGELNNALLHAERAVAFKPESATDRNLLGLVLSRNGDYARAMDELGIALDLAHDHKILLEILENVAETQVKQSKNMPGVAETQVKPSKNMPGVAETQVKPSKNMPGKDRGRYIEKAIKTVTERIKLLESQPLMEPKPRPVKPLESQPPMEPESRPQESMVRIGAIGMAHKAFGAIYFENADYPHAIEQFRIAEGYLKAVGGKMVYHYNKSCLHEGAALEKLGRFVEAEGVFLRLWDRIETQVKSVIDSRGKDPDYDLDAIIEFAEDMVNILRHIAKCRTLRGPFGPGPARAQALFQTELDLLKMAETILNLGDPKYPEDHHYLINETRGIIHVKRQEWDAAFDCLGKAIDSYCRATPPWESGSLCYPSWQSEDMYLYLGLAYCGRAERLCQTSDESNEKSDDSNNKLAIACVEAAEQYATPPQETGHSLDLQKHLDEELKRVRDLVNAGRKQRSSVVTAGRETDGNSG